MSTTKAPTLTSADTTPVTPTAPAPDKAPRSGILGTVDNIRATVDTARSKVAAAKDATTSARKTVRSLTFRNRRALVPWYAAAGTATLGTAAAVGAEFTDFPVDLAISGGTGAVALASGWALARRCAEQIDEAGMTGRVKAGVAASCAWCLTAPLTGVSATEMWLALGLGTVALSARWWQRIRPGYPAGTELVLAEEATVVAAATTKIVLDVAAAIMQAWAETITIPGGVLPGAELADPHAEGNTAEFTVRLVPGKHSVMDLRNAVVRIGSAIGYFADRITFDEGEVPTEATMRVRVASEVDTRYTGPRIVTEGGDVYIEIGAYLDGEGAARYHVSSPDSMNSGFLLGSKGSGKSRMLEIITTGYRKLGYEIWWLDPQEGASSAALRAGADWPLMGVHANEGEFVEYGNVLALWHAIRRVADIRQAENTVDKLDGFNHTRERPGIIVAIDECHKVCNVINPETGKTFGHDFGELDRVTRKLGIGFLFASQIFTMDTFGNSPALRSGLISGNLILMRMMEKSHVGLLPGGAPTPLGLPRGGGFGYCVDTEREHVMWRGWHNTDAQRWLHELPNATLDRRAGKAAGAQYRDRFVIAEAQADAAIALLQAFDSDDERALMALEAVRARAEPAPQAQPRLATVRVLPTRPSAPPAPGPAARVLPVRPSSLGHLAVPEGVPAAPLPPGAQRVMDVLADRRDWAVTDVAQVLGISEVAVRKHLKTIGETRLTKVRAGVYRAK